MNKLTLVSAILASSMMTPAIADAHGMKLEDINKAQQSWAKAIVEIGQAKIDGKDYESVAKQKVSQLYDFDDGTVLFKPTKAAEDQFRNSYDEAISYFVGGMVSEDTGFALQPWTNVRFENEDVALKTDYAVAMGNYYFTDQAGKEVKVEYTFGYTLAEDGSIKIDLHHSSLPYQP